jgi:hypothetical protein
MTGLLKAVRQALASRAVDDEDPEAAERQRGALQLVDEAQHDASLLQALAGEPDPDEEQEALLLLIHAKARLQANTAAYAHQGSLN